MPYCEFCGTEIDRDSVFCKKCGKKVHRKRDTYQDIFTSKAETSRQYQEERSSIKEGYQQIFHDKPISPVTQRLTWVGRDAPISDRCIALLIDDAIASFIPCFGFIYTWFKDSIREGQSIGKSFMGLRVVDFQTGIPASCEQSFIRNCCPGCFDGCCCYLTALMDENGRRIGDRAAGTIVILDQ
ncbi:MAG: RDD family protein [Candidatus Hodarchaeales archaeon]|jgi:hypothetical protein